MRKLAIHPIEGLTPIHVLGRAISRRSTYIMLASLVLSVYAMSDCARADEPDPFKAPSDSRIKILMYDDTDVYTITTRYGYQTNIVFSGQEDIETISVGDRSMWQIVPAGNRIFIRPMEEDVITNMTVLTNKHSYQFDIKSASSDNTDGVVYVAKFSYKDDKAKAPVMAGANYGPNLPPPGVNTLPEAALPVVARPSPAAAAVVAAPVPVIPAPVIAPPPVVEMPVPQVEPVPAIAVNPPVTQGPISPQNPNYNYTYAGPDDLAPLQVYDDGQSTFLKYRDIDQPKPNVFAVDEEGKETPLTYNLKGDFVIVDTVAQEILLKNSDGTVHIYNEMLNPR